MKLHKSHTDSILLTISGDLQYHTHRWHTLFLIIMHKLDLLMIHVQSFCCFEQSGVILGIFYFSYEVFCSFFFGISNFLIYLFEYLFSWFSQLFVLLWVFAIFNSESYVLLFFWHPFKVWIWYLVVICFLLVSCNLNIAFFFFFASCELPSSGVTSNTQGTFQRSVTAIFKML